jgi:hypothetical protein
VVLQSAEGGFFCKSNEKSATVDWSMRRLVPPLLAASAALFFAWEVYAVMRWVHDAGGIGNAFGHFWAALSSDWMALIVVSDHLVIAAAVLVALWIDTTRLGWLVRGRALLAITFVLLGSPALLVYLAWRMGAGGRSITG